MPIYNIECPNCQYSEEILTKSRNPKKPCPRCKQAKMRKVMSLSNFEIKGSNARNSYGLKEEKKDDKVKQEK